MNNTTVKNQYIYVIDDSNLHNVLMEKLLKLKGYTVQTFTDSVNLLEELKEDPPHLIISDIEMPGMNGFELFDEIQKLPDAKEVPLLYISSINKKQIIDQIETKGAAGFIPKPVIHDTLLKAVAQNCN